MKRVFILLLISKVVIATGQTFSSNDTPVGLEHNVLFNANKGRFQVTQSGQAQLNLDYLFDGRFDPSYSGVAVSSSNPTVITISGLPAYHTQRGAWVGWSTRYWAAKKFKIEGYNDWGGSQTGWVVIADVDNYSHGSTNYYTRLPDGAYSQLRFTFYEGTTDPYGGNRIGISELIYIHPEVVTPYQGLFTIFKNLTEVNNNVLIGKTTQNNAAYKLDVAGKIRADEIIVNTTGADFVFDSTYKLRTLPELETFIKQNKHLPEIAPAKEMQENGVSAGEMQAKLLQKIEELTLYVIELKKENEELLTEKDVLHMKQQAQIQNLSLEIEKLKEILIQKL
jgi:hypothetical protein